MGNVRAGIIRYILVIYAPGSLHRRHYLDDCPLERQLVDVLSNCAQRWYSKRHQVVPIFIRRRNIMPEHCQCTAKFNCDHILSSEVEKHSSFRHQWFFRWSVVTMEALVSKIGTPRGCIDVARVPMKLGPSEDLPGCNFRAMCPGIVANLLKHL